MTGGILFDFDGTLVDTFDDIVDAVQQMRSRLGAQALPPEEIRRHIGWGAPVLIARTHPQLDALRPDRLPAEGEPVAIARAQVEQGLQFFREAYAQVMLLHAHPYPGIPALCNELVADGMSLAVVSNKPERFVRQVMAGLGLVDPFTAVVAGDTLPMRKPDPTPILHAAHCIGLPRERCVMVGDGRLDIAAARAAGIPCCAVTWGLLSADALVPLAPAYLARSADELGTWIRRTLRMLTRTP